MNSFFKTTIALILLLNYNAQSQNAIEYKFPKNVVKLIAKEYKNTYYDTTKMYLYIRFQNNNNSKYFISLASLDKSVINKGEGYYILNTNRYVLVDSVKIPIIFNTDLLFNKGMVTFNRETFIEFSTDGKIYRKSKELD
jgi:hypothetical protein